MDTGALMTSPAASEYLGAGLPPLVATIFTVWGVAAAVAGWLARHAVAVGLGACVLWWGGNALRTRLARRALGERVHLRLRPSRQFAPDDERVLRFGAQAVRAAGGGPWWAPRCARTVRIRLRADGTRALDYLLEAPASAKHLLMATPYGRHVQVEEYRPPRDRQRRHVVRAVFTLHGHPASRLREVPLDPDPLQPVIDAVTDMRRDQGDLAEVCLDISPAVAWRIAWRRAQVLYGARVKARQEARRDARWMAEDAALVEDSLLVQLSRLATPEAGRAATRRWLAPVPQRINRERVLGKLVEATDLVRIQLLVRCASNRDGRAERRLRQLEAALDVFGAKARFAHAGHRLGPLRWGPDRWPLRKDFDERFATGLIRPRRDDWASLSELAGWLKPPTAAASLPLLASDIPRYHVGAKGLLPQGYYRTPDGREVLLATRESETLFETAIGRTRWGKTERALVQAVGHAMGGGALAFVDPHRDTWQRALPYLAHDSIVERLWLVDLSGHSSSPRLPTWNPLAMDTGPLAASAHEVVADVLDAFTTTTGWQDATHPRALSILTQATAALVAVNAAAVAAGSPEAQATLFQIRPLLTDPAFRAAVVEHLPDDDARWWHTTFANLPEEAMTTVLNPLDRLGRHPTTRAFLGGSATSGYRIRTAMDGGAVVWICTPGSGPTDRLIVALLVRDVLRAGLARRAVAPRRRRPFRLYLDELISLDGAAAGSLADITEQLAKFDVRMHGMTQLLHRLSGPVRAALLQNASSLSTTAGSIEAIGHITAEWGGQVDPAEVAALDRFWHYASFTVAGRRLGPLLLRGGELGEVFGDVAADRQHTRQAHQAALAHVQARPLPALLEAAAAQEQVVRDFLDATGPSGVRLTKARRAPAPKPGGDNNTGTDLR